MFKAFLRKVLPIKLIWFLGNFIKYKPFLSDVASSERIVEYGWVLQHLPKSGFILDVGCTGSMFSQQMASLGYKVTGVDRKDYDLVHPNFGFAHCMAEDITKCTKFDAITCVSTMEHTAIREGEYDRTLKALLGMLSYKGVLLMTVPCGVPKMFRGHRVFGVNEIPDGDYFISVRKGMWVKATKEAVSMVNMTERDYVKAIACVVFKNE